MVARMSWFSKISTPGGGNDVGELAGDVQRVRLGAAASNDALAQGR
jgi:hypothetical protein